MSSTKPNNTKIEGGWENPDSLNARRTVARSFSSMKIRLINYLNKVEEDGENTSRFGSCNEFTMGIHHEKTKGQMLQMSWECFLAIF